MNDKKNRVKILRKNLKLTQKEFGDAIGVSNSNISNIENGKNYPSMINLENLLNVLDCTFTEAFDFEHKNSNEDLITQITKRLKSNPDKLEDFYKIVMALTK